jgi:hypothetical protein
MKPALRFTLRWALAATALLCIVFTWIGYERNKAERGANAIDLLERHGALVISYEKPSSRSQLLILILGDDRYRTVAGVILKPEQGTQEDVAVLSEFPNLAEVTGCGRLVTDKNLNEVSELTNLRQLDLSRSLITDPNLSLLLALPKLEILSLAHTSVGDDGVKGIKSLNLWQLSLAYSHISDKGMRHVGDIGTLTSLDLTATSISDAGLSELARIPSLESVTITDTRFVTDQGVKQLQATLPDLELEDRFGRPNE